MLNTITEPTHIQKLRPALILKLQNSLEKLNYDVGEIDGIYGNNTLYAFNRFKEDYCLTNPNEIGPTTVKILEAALNGELDRDEEGDKEPHPNQPNFDKANDIPTKIIWTDFNCPISKYFTVGEVSKFSKDRIVYIKQPQDNAIKLAKLLDKIREEWGSGLGVTSWYRPIKVNNAVGGARNSQHLTASGVDIYPLKGSGREFEQWLDQRWLRALGYGQRSERGFSHLDLRSTMPLIRWNY